MKKESFIGVAQILMMTMIIKAEHHSEIDIDYEDFSERSSEDLPLY